MNSAKLIIRSQGQPDQEVRLAGGASIGRAFDNSVRVDVDGVSRYHAIIEQKADGFWLSDLGSRNGTTINGVAVSSDRKLKSGEYLNLGGTATLQFRIENGSLAAEPSKTGGAQAANDPSAASSQETSSGVKRALLIGLGIVVVVVGVFVIAQLVSSSGSRSDSRKAEVTAGSGGGAANPQLPDSGKSGGGTTGNANDAAAAAGAAKAAVENADSGDKTAGAENPGPVDLRITQECQKLAGLIVNKNGSGYVFDAAFVADVLKHIDEYRIDMKGPVQTHRFQINKAFGATPLHKVTGYLLAISRSKFKDAPGDPGGTGL